MMASILGNIPKSIVRYDDSSTVVFLPGRCILPRLVLDESSTHVSPADANPSRATRSLRRACQGNFKQ